DLGAGAEGGRGPVQVDHVLQLTGLHVVPAAVDLYTALDLVRRRAGVHEIRRVQLKEIAERLVVVRSAVARHVGEAGRLLQVRRHAGIADVRGAVRENE